jgi:hypothetical protein
MNKRRRLIEAYVDAKVAITKGGFGHEIDWQYLLDFEAIGESQFLQELAWVVLNSGMREMVVRKRFGGVAAAYLHWESASRIAANSESCREAALCEFGHRGKIDAIISAARRVDCVGFNQIKAEIADRGASYLESFDFIGRVTSLHLAKNLGLDVVKPDRHLCRVAEVAGYDSPATMCRFISEETGDKVSVVDLVIWRYATVTGDYCRRFAVAQ